MTRRFKAVAAGWVLALAAPVAGASVTGTCSPAQVDHGVLTTGETFLATVCTPPAGFVPGSDRVDYLASFNFEVAASTTFYAHVQGTFYPARESQPVPAGIGVIATLYYGDQLVVTDPGGGIGGAERPPIINPVFNPAFDLPALPTGAYRIDVRGTGFGPVPEGRISTRIYATVDGPVSPVPEPRTAALQGVALALLAAGVLLHRRRRHAAG